MACRFRNGLTDNSPRGRPPCKDKKQTLTVKNVIESDRRSAGCSKSTAQRFLTADLGMSHVSARWEPRLLTEEENLLVPAHKGNSWLEKE